MRRSILYTVIASLVATTLLLLCSAGPVLASDNDVPGVALALGGSISQTVDAGDPNDVYSVNLTAGQEVYIRCDPGNSYTGEGYIHLLVPGTPTIDRSEEGDEISFGPVMGGVPYQTKRGGYFHYIPAVSGTHYLWVEWATGKLDYKLSVERKERTLLLAQDSDDIPGTAIGPGTVNGVVSTLADHYDVYAVGLTAGKTATVELKAFASLESYFVSTARLSLLGPGAMSVDETSAVLVAGPKEATNATATSVSIQYAPSQSGTYYVVVEAGPFGGLAEGSNFAYALTVTGNEPVGGASFSDVRADHPYYAAITDLASRGIISGYGGDREGLFGPSDLVRRQQFAKMIVGSLGLPVSEADFPHPDVPFVDLGPDNPADLYPHEYVAVCARNGITLGKDATHFDPFNYITRYQVISMVVRAANNLTPGLLMPPPPDYGIWRGDRDHGANAASAEYNGLLTGLTLSALNPRGSMTRGEVAQVLHNLLDLLAY